MLTLPVLRTSNGLILFASELRDGVREGMVEAVIEQAKIVGADGRIHFHRELDDGLTDGAIVVHDL
jgi:hypothetical protein